MHPGQRLRLTLTLLGLSLALGPKPIAAQREPNYQSRYPSKFNTGPAELGAGVPRSTTLRGQPLANNIAFGRPFFLAAAAGRLWVTDISGEPWLHLVRIADGYLERSGGGRGEGPGYFTSVTDLSRRPGDTLGIWAFDGQLGRLTYLTHERRTLPPQTITAQAPERLPIALRWLTQIHLIGVRPTDTSASLVVYDSLGRSVRSSHFEILGDSTIPYRKRRNPSGGVRICVKPGGAEFAVLFVAGARIDRYRADLTRLPGFEVPFASNGDFERDAQGRWQAYLPRSHYRDCAATAQHLYALYSGRLEAKYPEGVGREGIYVQVFDWDGKLKRVLRLSRGASAFAVVGDSVMYASTLATDTIYRYQIPGN